MEFMRSTSFAVVEVGITQYVGRLLFAVGVGLFYFSTLLTVLSGGLYVQAAWPILTAAGGR
jgi:hypothetical protein